MKQTEPPPLPPPPSPPAVTGALEVPADLHSSRASCRLQIQIHAALAHQRSDPYRHGNSSTMP
ncbi:hypothetical protein NQZ68_008297 [Dissostichus eleginoides]|nr:hypothetical protein NQZ68_008297 [Dissostichus eleginoides]